MIEGIHRLLRMTRSRGIARRYFVTNGFDGALATLGLILGFYFSREVPLSAVINACLGTALALGVSGVTSAYISEAAERRRELRELEEAMATDLGDTAHGAAARRVPWVIGFVNGASPLSISLLILAPLLLARWGWRLPADPFHASIALALAAIFLMGVFLGRISGESWLRAGLRIVVVAAVTVLLIFTLTSRADAAGGTGPGEPRAFRGDAEKPQVERGSRRKTVSWRSSASFSSPLPDSTASGRTGVFRCESSSAGASFGSSSTGASRAGCASSIWTSASRFASRPA